MTPPKKDDDIDVHIFTSGEEVAHKFDQLNHATKKFLSKLGDKDVEALEDAVLFWLEFRTFLKWTKWLVYFFVAIFLGVVSIAQGWSWLVSYISKELGK